VLVGGGRHFLHYRCATCAEVWTAQTAEPVGRLGRSAAEDLVGQARRDKVLLN
jgi:hypothetical protein